MNFGEIKKLVAAYCTRAPASYSATGVDVLGRAVNNALLWAQRQHDFEMCRTRGQLTVSFLAGASLDNVTAIGGTDTIDVKKIEMAYLIDDSQPGSYDGIPLRFYSRYVDAYRQRRLNPGGVVGWPPPGTEAASADLSNMALIQHGNDVYLSPGVLSQYPTATEKVVVLDLVAFEPELVADEDTNFFLDYCTDFVMAKAIQSLNFYHKEDPRAASLDGEVTVGWRTLLQWDTSLAADDNGDLD